MDIKNVYAPITKAEEAELYTAWASTKEMDRDEEIILPTAVRNLKAFLNSNPVIYFDHAWMSWTPSEESLPVAKAVHGFVDEEKGVQISFQFHDLEFAQKIKYLVDEGVLNTMSIGFIPKEWDFNDEGHRVYTDVELLEVSVVGIPSNRSAEILRAMDPGKRKVAAKYLTDVTMKNPSETAEADTSEAGTDTVEPSVKKPVLKMARYLINQFKKEN